METRYRALCKYIPLFSTGKHCTLNSFPTEAIFVILENHWLNLSLNISPACEPEMVCPLFYYT